jgi:hypothetical protein
LATVIGVFFRQTSTESTSLFRIAGASSPSFGGLAISTWPMLIPAPVRKGALGSGDLKNAAFAPSGPRLKALALADAAKSNRAIAIVANLTACWNMATSFVFANCLSIFRLQI